MDTKKIWNQCRKKHRYRSEHDANLYRRLCEEERGKKLDYYWCPYCKGYHLTSEDFRPEGYGLHDTGADAYEYVHVMMPNEIEDKNYYLGKRNRIHVTIDEYEQMLAM